MIKIIPKNKQLLKSSKVRKWLAVVETRLFDCIDAEALQTAYVNSLMYPSVKWFMFKKPIRSSWDSRMTGWVNDDPSAKLQVKSKRRPNEKKSCR